MEGTAAAGVEARHIADGAGDEIARQERRRGDVADIRQMLHVVVEGRERALGGVLEHLVEAILRLAGEDGDAELLRDFDVGLGLVQHGETAGHVKAADHHLYARGQQRAGNVERAGELVRLHADQPDQSDPAMAGDAPGDRLRPHPGVGLVDGQHVDGEVGAEHVPRGGAQRQAIDGGERVRRHGRAEPLHDIAVGIVMRRLDEDELKAPTCCPAQCVGSR